MDVEHLIEDLVPRTSIGAVDGLLDPVGRLVVEPVEWVGGRVGLPVCPREGNACLEKRPSLRESSDGGLWEPPNELKITGVRVAVGEAVPNRVVGGALVGPLLSQRRVNLVPI
jgi:hypothetical protein